MNEYLISPEQATTTAYRAALSKEIAIGESVSLQDMKKNRINAPAILNYKARILGGGAEANEYADWLDFVIDRYGPRQKCLSLGSGLGRVEEYLIRNKFATKIDSIELCADVNSGLRISSNQIVVLQGDLNFVRLPKNTYDFILCHGVLHHLLNLEHVLSQIRDALRPSGILLVYEYVGESRWQFSTQRMAYLRAAFPGIPFVVPPRWSVGGFESVRSADLLPLLELYFGQQADVSTSYGGVYFPFITCTNGKYDHLLERVVELDAASTGASAISPSYHMGIYRSGGKATAQAAPWSDAQVFRELAPSMPWAVDVGQRIRQTPIWKTLRRIRTSLSE